jgi:glutamate-1-semialdehyde 2,1-aminomutase
MMKKNGQLLYKKAKRIIPGGTQLLTKRSELHLPELWPAYFEKAKGCEIWDLGAKRYIDMSFMGIGACMLGYADRDVDRAVKLAIDKGAMTTLNCYEEVELAEVLCKLHPWAQMSRFARTGGEAMAVAVRIARTKTEREIVLFCGYHGWHDWYLAANLADDQALDGHLLPGLEPKGVPRSLKGSSIPFQYNDTESFLRLIEEYKGRIAAVVVEPIRNYYPQKGFLEIIREKTEKLGIVFIFDEITSGFRLTLGGAHLKFKVFPDLAVFAKGMSNGFPMAAIIGRKKIMSAAEDSFISSTYWTERIGPVAALATIKKLEERKVAEYLIEAGKKVQAGWQKMAKIYNLDITVSGIYPLSHFTLNYDNSSVLKTLFTQLMLDKGFLATTSFYASYAHQDKYIEQYLNSVGAVFHFISKTIKQGTSERHLKASVCHSGFKRLT